MVSLENMEADAHGFIGNTVCWSTQYQITILCLRDTIERTSFSKYFIGLMALRCRFIAF